MDQVLGVKKSMMRGHVAAWRQLEIWRKAIPGTVACVMPLLWCGEAKGLVDEGWDAGTDRTLIYDIVVDMAYDEDAGDFTEVDTRTLTVMIDGDQHTVAFHYVTTFDQTNQEFGPYGFSEDGIMTLSPGTEPPPLEAELLLHIFPPPPLIPGLTSWTTRDPGDTDLEVLTLAIQQKTDFAVTGTRTVKAEALLNINIEGGLRLIDNAFLQAWVGLPGERPEDVEQAVAALGDFNLFLVGALSWSFKERATAAAEFTYVPFPHVGSTVGSISSSIYRQHMVVALRPEVSP